jgi:ubiquinone/menaquinone biosynthesis C-methylase UbiE
MGFHTFDPEGAQRLNDVSRFRFCSREELLQWLPSSGTVLDLGSGTGFYTDEIAPFVDRVVGVDVQAEMHAFHRENGVASNVSLVTGAAGTLPFRTDSIDGAFSTMTFHETTTEQSLAELHRVLAPGAPFVVVDWSSAGEGERGPPLAERFDAETAGDLLRGADFAIDALFERAETFVAVGTA